MHDTFILGAGVAGLAAAYASNFRYPIYEATSAAGGLCSGFDIDGFHDGFHFDKAVHLSFAKDGIVRGVFDQVPYHCYAPYPQNWYYDRWIKHPVQNNLFALTPDERVKAVKTFVERPRDMEPKNFYEWNISRFGTYLSNEFVFQYNQKYWCEKLELLGVDWIGGRLYQPSLEEVLLGSFTDRTENTYYAKEMRYPKEGGFGSFLSPLISQAEIHYNKRVARIDGAARTVQFSDGVIQPYRKLISSIPLTEMSNIVGDMPKEIKVAANELNHTGMVLVSVGFRRPVGLDELWFYIYDRDILAARVHSPAGKAAENIPEGCFSLQFEIYFNGRSTPPEEDVCIQNTLTALKRILGDQIEEKIQFVNCRTEKYANVIMYPDNRRNAGRVRDYLKQIGVTTIGRLASGITFGVIRRFCRVIFQEIQKAQRSRCISLWKMELGRRTILSV